MESYEHTTVRIAPAQPPCALVQDLLPLYLEGEVSSGSNELIIEHLSHCERCSGFLAGAQSVRGQLAIERRAHAAVSQSAQPERRAMLHWRAALAGAAALIICMIGGGASIMLGVGDEAAVAGVLIGMGALGALLLLARVLGPLNGQRLGRLATSVGTGILAGIVLGGGGSDGMVLSGMLLSLVATGMVCVQLAREAAWQAAPASPHTTR